MQTQDGLPLAHTYHPPCQLTTVVQATFLPFLSTKARENNIPKTAEEKLENILHTTDILHHKDNGVDGFRTAKPLRLRRDSKEYIKYRKYKNGSSEVRLFL